MDSTCTGLKQTSQSTLSTECTNLIAELLLQTVATESTIHKTAVFQTSHKSARQIPGRFSPLPIGTPNFFTKSHTFVNFTRRSTLRQVYKFYNPCGPIRDRYMCCLRRIRVTAIRVQSTLRSDWQRRQASRSGDLGSVEETVGPVGSGGPGRAGPSQFNHSIHGHADPGSLKSTRTVRSD